MLSDYLDTYIYGDKEYEISGLMRELVRDGVIDDRYRANWQIEHIIKDLWEIGAIEIREWYFNGEELEEVI